MREVGRQVLYQQGCYSWVKIWYTGFIPGIHGLYTRGWQNEPQTVVTKSVITPTVTLEVKYGRKVA